MPEARSTGPLPPPSRRRTAGRTRTRGDALRARLAASPVEARASERVWSVLARSALAESGSGGPEPSPPAAGPGGGPGGGLAEEAGFHPGGSARYRIDMVGPGGVRTVFAAGIVLCPGAVERVVPFPGWTLPGVIGLAAATVLIKSQRLLPGRRVVVAGAVRSSRPSRRGSSRPAARSRRRRPRRPFRLAPRRARLAAMPRLLARGGGWAARIAAARVPVFFRHSVRSAAGSGSSRRSPSRRSIRPAAGAAGPAAGGAPNRRRCARDRPWTDPGDRPRTTAPPPAPLRPGPRAAGARSRTSGAGRASRTATSRATAEGSAARRRRLSRDGWQGLAPPSMRGGSRPPPPRTALAALTVRTPGRPASEPR